MGVLARSRRCSLIGLTAVVVEGGSDLSLR